MLTARNIVAVIVMLTLCLFLGRFVYLIGLIFCVFEITLIVIAVRRCADYKRYADDFTYAKKTEKYYDSAETAFTMMVACGAFAVAEILRDIIVFHSIVRVLNNPGLWYLLFVAGNIFFFLIAGDKVKKMKMQKSTLENPPVISPEKFFSEIVGQKEVSDDHEIGRAYVSEKLLSEIPQDELVPDEEELQYILQQRKRPDNPDEAEQDWTCQMCGSDNPARVEECVFCGAKREKGEN